jgi:hypothetical protein
MSDRTILNPQYSNSLNNLFNGTGDIDLGTVVVNKLTVDSSNNDNDYSLSCYSNTLAVNCPTTITPSFQIGNSNQYVQLKCPTTGVLQTKGLQLTDTPGTVLIKPIATNYIGLVDTTAGTNTASVQGGTFNALTSITSPSYNIFASNGNNTDITFDGTGNFINIPSNLFVNQSMSAGNYQGGLYSGKYVSNPIRTIPPSGTSTYTFNIPWNPTTGWVVDTITPLFTYVSDYPIATNTIALVANGIYQLQITIQVSNGSGTQPTNLYSINYIIMNNA